MVVVVTFHDNDYGEILERIGDLWKIGFQLIDNPNTKDSNKIEYWIKIKELWDNVIRNPNFTPKDLEKLNHYDYSTIVGIIRAWIIHYLEGDDSIVDDKERLLLIKDLEVSLTFTINESNQNGEYLYYIVRDRVSIIR